MALRHTLVVAAVGIGLPFAGIAAPAEAATTSTTSTTQCQTLLTCVVPIVTGLTGGLVGTVPTLLNAVPKIVGSVPQTLTTLLGGNHSTGPTQGTKTPPKTPQHGKPPVKTPPHRTPPTTSSSHLTPVPKKTTTATTTPTVAHPTVIPPQPISQPNPVIKVVQQVAHLAQQVVSLFGWNLLALIPMAGIALVISRRMAAGRRSASGLL